MKLRRTRLSLFIVVLMLAAQITVAPSTARAAQNMSQDHSQHNMGIPDSRCRRRCSNEYRRCLRRGKNRRACARQLRNCQRRCPQ